MTITVKSGIPLPLIRGEHNQAMLAALQKLKKNQCLDVTQGTAGRIYHGAAVQEGGAGTVFHLGPGGGNGRAEPPTKGTRMSEAICKHCGKVFNPLWFKPERVVALCPTCAYTNLINAASTPPDYEKALNPQPEANDEK